jgi:hypothetical protein
MTKLRTTRSLAARPGICSACSVTPLNERLKYAKCVRNRLLVTTVRYVNSGTTTLRKASTIATTVAFVDSARGWGKTFSTAKHVEPVCLFRPSQRTNASRRVQSATARFVATTCSHPTSQLLSCAAVTASTSHALPDGATQATSARSAQRASRIWKANSEDSTGILKSNPCQKSIATRGRTSSATIATAEVSPATIGLV